MNDLAIENCRVLNSQLVVESLNVSKARESKKWSCPSCGSSDALHVYPGAGRGSHCFSCGKSMDAIDLVQAMTGLGFKRAVDWLANEFGFSDLMSGHTDLQEVKRRQKKIREQIEEKKQEKRRLQEARRRDAIGIYLKLFRQMSLGPVGRRYLKSRGIPQEVGDHFGICSVESDGEWEKIRSNFWVDELEAAGLLGQNDRGTFPVPWRTPFLVIPYIKNDRLDILRFRDLTGGTPKYLSPLGHKPRAPYLSWDALEFADDYSTLYVCEGEINALSIVYAGAPAVGACGSGTWQAEWSKGFRWYQNVVVLCDGDKAGEKFAEMVRDATQKSLGRDWVNRRLRKRKFVEGMDANDALQKGALKEMLYAS